MSKTYFDEEIKETSYNINQVNGEGTLTFALVTDTHLSDTRDETCDNILRVDAAVGFRFIMHMGDFLTGGIPEKASWSLLRKEMECYKNSIDAQKLFVIQGNHDGYRNETFNRQLVDNIVFDEAWYEQTSFIDAYDGLFRPAKKPYYYVDFPNEKVRLICLCSAYYSFDAVTLDYQKKLGFDNAQVCWFEDIALNAPRGYTILVFSHIAPLSELGGTASTVGEQMAQRGGKRMVEALSKAHDGKNINVACWFSGDSHADVSVRLREINFVTTASQTPYIPQLWKMKLGEFPKNRDLGTANQDLWDSAVLNTSKRCIYLCRFGAGEDRVIKY